MKISEPFEDVFDLSATALDRAIPRIARAVPAPQRIRTASGHVAYRYLERLPQQALVLKVVRAVSALKAGKTLLDAGLALDVGAFMRLLDEVGSDIYFIAGPLVMGEPSEARHAEYLLEFFQEEFDHPDPVQSSQKRKRVSRRDIRAYVARTFNAGHSVSQVVAVTETIDNAFSGYIHGAAVHTMDAFDGRKFHSVLEQGDAPLEALREQFPQYTHRALMGVAVAAKAVGDEELFTELFELQRNLYDDCGNIR